MRGCLTILVIAAGFVLAVGWFGGPALAAVLVERSLSSAGFASDGTTVAVTADPPLELLAGHADRVVIDARDASVGDITADRLSLTLGTVDLIERRFSRVDGRLEDVSIQSADGPPVHARSVTLRGRADAATTTIHVDEATLTTLLTDAIEARTGLPVSGMTLAAPDTIRFTAGLPVVGRFEVAPDGSLVIAVTSGLGSRFRIFSPPSDVRLTSAAVEGSDLVLVGETDLTALLR